MKFKGLAIAGENDLLGTGAASLWDAKSFNRLLPAEGAPGLGEKAQTAGV